jgi:hypothetical protein
LHSKRVKAFYLTYLADPKRPVNTTPCTVIEVYNKLMQALLVILSPEELFAISLEVRNQLHEAITPKRVLNETVSTHAVIEQVPDEVPAEGETSITVPDVYETYINSLAPGEGPIPLNVAQESHALRSIMMVVDNREEVEGIIDPGSPDYSHVRSSLP